MIKQHSKPSEGCFLMAFDGISTDYLKTQKMYAIGNVKMVKLTAIYTGNRNSNRILDFYIFDNDEIT